MTFAADSSTVPPCGVCSVPFSGTRRVFNKLQTQKMKKKGHVPRYYRSLQLRPRVRAAAVHVGLIAARLELRALGIVGHLGQSYR